MFNNFQYFQDSLHVFRAAPNIRFVFASGPNNGPNSYSVFDLIVAAGPNTNSGHLHKMTTFSYYLF